MVRLENRVLHHLNDNSGHDDDHRKLDVVKNKIDGLNYPDWDIRNLAREAVKAINKEDVEALVKKINDVHAKDKESLVSTPRVDI